MGLFKKTTFILFLLINSCTLSDDSSNTNYSQNSPINNLNPYTIPKNCDYEKIFVFKVVCDQERDIFGIDQSFVEGICQSELDVLEGLPEKDVNKFLQARLRFFNQSWSQVKIQSKYAFMPNMDRVQITAFINNRFSNSVTCSLNNGKDRIEVNVDVNPICKYSDGKYHHLECGVNVNSFAISNNGYSLNQVHIDHEGSIEPELAYRFTHGYIYQKSFAPKTSNYSFTNYYSSDPTEKIFYMKKDYSSILDKYR